MDNQERVYELIYNSEGMSRKELTKALSLRENEVKEVLDTLYSYGLIDTEKGTYVAVDEEMIAEAYVDRNVDLNYLKETVDVEVVKTMLREEFGEFLEEVKTKPSTTVEWRIAEIERKTKVLEALYKNLKELKRIR